MSTNSNFSGKSLDELHNEIIDRDEVVNRLLTDVDAQRDEINRASGETGRAIRMLNERKLLIKGATDFSIPESHLTDMHALLNEKNTEVAMMSETIAALKLENNEASSEMSKMKLSICGQPSNAAPLDECEEKCAKLKSKMEEMKQEKNEEVRKLKDDLQKIEERKDHYKNNFSQAEDGANDEEQEYRAEAEAFEKLRNEYNLNVSWRETRPSGPFHFAKRRNQYCSLAKDY